ncbi:MAG TPA: hypothetical protein VGR51_01350 [Thermoplasmata archaeon]|nr:hypothetical protein [Thermoplasmata archaeon]
MLATANRCGVCGWRGDDTVCPKCGTVLLRGSALCRRCGKLFEGPIARCDACGGAVEPPRDRDHQAIERLSHLPGVDATRAEELYSRGFHDPADVLKLALPERAVRMGLHKTLARKATMGELRPVKHVKKTIACPTCGAPRDAKAERCGTCGSPWERPPRPEEVRRQFEAVTGEVWDLSADPDFREMPTEMRDEILDAFEGAGLAVSTENEFAEQIRAWQRHKFDTRELERIVREEGAEAFRMKSVRIIRSQLMKRRKGDTFACPLCEVPLPPAVADCGNCGAKFR